MENETQEKQSSAQTYEEKKAEKEKRREAASKGEKKKQKTKTIVRTLIAIAVLGLLGFLFVRAVQKELPEGKDYGIFYESQGQEHIDPEAEHPAYSSNPPSSGWHLASPAPVGFYADALPDERVIHNLEHGDIWIAYHPRVSEGVVQALRAFEHDGKVIITPREENDTDISLVAWERVDSFAVAEDGSVDTQRIADFIKRHRNQAPEKVNQPHVGSGDEIESMEQAVE